MGLAIIDKIVGKHRDRHKAKLADFGDLVRQIADGHEPDVEQVDRVLREAGKSLDDLKAAVELLQRRRALKAQWDRMPELTARRQKLEDEMAAVNKALDEAEDRHDKAFRPLETEHRAVRDEISAAERAQSALWESCRDGRLRARLDEVQANLRKAHGEHGELRTAIDRCRRLAEADRDRADRLVFDKESDDLRKRADERDAESKRLQARLRGVEKQIADIERQEAAIRDEMLVP